MKHHYAWVNISGKVFVSRPDLEDRLKEKYPKYAEQIEMCEKDNEGTMNIFDLCTPEEEQETFQEIAGEKIDELFRSDEPIKMNEAIIDMTSYTHN